MIDDRGALEMGEVVPFGRRPIPPRACIVENKTHVRTFITEMLDELGFIAREAGTPDIRTVLHDFRPDLIVLGPLMRSGGALGHAHPAGTKLRRKTDVVWRAEFGGPHPQP